MNTNSEFSTDPITISHSTLKQALEALEAMTERFGFARLGSSSLADTMTRGDAHVAINNLRAALAQQAEPVKVADRERVASQWDGCVTHQLDAFGPVDIGASIRAGELVEAQQDEPVPARASACRLTECAGKPMCPPCVRRKARNDGMPGDPDERYLRRLLAVRVGMPHTYYDDGEAQGQEHGIVIDFMREPVAHIDAKLRALNVARAAPPQQAVDGGVD